MERFAGINIHFGRTNLPRNILLVCAAVFFAPVLTIESGASQTGDTDGLQQPEGSAAKSAYGSANEARAMLTKVVAAVKSDKNRALGMFNKGEEGFLDRDLYPFCINVSDGMIVAQGGPLSQKYLGQDMRPLEDATGKAYGSEIYAAAQKPEGEITEVRYMFPKPIVGSPPVPKISYVTRIGDIGCGVGYYVDLARPVTRDEAVSHGSSISTA